MRRGLLVPLVALGAALPLAAIVIARDAVDRPDGMGVRDAYSWTKPKPRPRLLRTEVAGAAVGDDIYVIGGFVRPRRTTAAVERLHRGHWRRVRNLPQPLNHAAAVGYRGRVYVLGGYANPAGLTQPQKTLYRYDPRRDRWTRLPDMPTARAALAFAAMGGALYAAGGADGSNQTAALEIYDIKHRRWRRGPSLSVAREHLGGAVVGGRFYAVAGRNRDSGNLAIVEGYDAAKHAWTRLPDMPKTRGGNGAAALDGYLVAVGGEEAGGTIAQIDMFDFQRRKWMQLDPMPTPRHGLAVASDSSGDVWTVSGGPQPGLFFSNAVERLG